VVFANTAGGILLIGVEDRNRNVRGVSDPLD
jgi:predicted HTH transcriptional regulator